MPELPIGTVPYSAIPIYPWRHMAIEDWFKFKEGTQEGSARALASRWGSKLGNKFGVRSGKSPSDKDEAETWICVRIS